MPSVCTEGSLLVYCWALIDWPYTIYTLLLLLFYIIFYFPPPCILTLSPGIDLHTHLGEVAISFPGH